MARPITMYFAPSNTTALLSTTATTGGASTSIGLTNPYPYIFNNLARTITITSSDNVSAVNITITGKDIWGNTISETRVGPNNTTVTSTNQYNQITNIACDAALTNFSFGSGSTGTFIWAKLNQFNNSAYTTIQADVTGTINYSVNQTADTFDYFQNNTLIPQYQYPRATLLGNNPINVANASTTATLTVPSTVGLQVGQLFSIQGASGASGLTAAQTNGTFAIVSIASATTLTYIAVANGNGVAGGGALAYLYVPNLPVSYAVVAALTAATTSQIYNLNSAAYALQGIVNSSTSGSLLLTYLQQGVV